MELEGPRRGTRDNGLRCAGYVAVADLDPRVADTLLGTLRDAGIAAYAAPTPGTMGGFGEVRMPDRPLDRLWVDDAQTERARALLDTEAAPPAPAPPMHAQVTPAEPRDGLRTDADFDAAWQEVLASLQTSTEAPLPSWPEEPVDAEGGVDPADEDHFVPPPPPPLPRLRSVTAAALGAIALGLFILATGVDGGNLTVFAVIAILAGVASLVWNMRNGPPTDSGWDDGAVI